MPRRTYSRRAGRRRRQHIGLEVDRILAELRRAYPGRPVPPVPSRHRPGGTT